MKRFMTILSGMMLFINTEAQTLGDSAVYIKGLNMIESAVTAEDYETVAVYFDELSSSRTGEWLAPLYAGLSYVLASYHDTDGKRKDRLCDKAQLYLDTANARHGDESEIAAVQAFLYQARIDVNPTERGLDYSLKADSEIKKAERDNVADPRPYFLHAMNVYYTPRIFGGGAEKALPLFETAAEKYKSFKPVMPFMPHWGEQQNLEMIAKCKGTTGK